MLYGFLMYDFHEFQVQAIISKLTQEKNSTILQTNKLQQELVRDFVLQLVFFYSCMISKRLHRFYLYLKTHHYTSKGLFFKKKNFLQGVMIRRTKKVLQMKLLGHPALKKK